MSITSPMDFGADGTGSADDLAALNAAEAALPAAGGIVYLPPGQTFRKDNVWMITRPVKIWAENRGATIFGRTGGVANRQAIHFVAQAGCGVFGLRFTSDATVRGDGFDANAIELEDCGLSEVCGTEIAGAEAVGIFAGNTDGTFFEGNYVHDTLADHIHHVYSARNGYCWGNWLYNGGDDGIAIVSYAAQALKCHDFEIWQNKVISTPSARGIALVGGQFVNIHHNDINLTGAAGILVGSESSYLSHTVSDATVSDNVIYNCAQAVTSHTGELVSGGNGGQPALSNIVSTNNVIYRNPVGSGAYRTEGSIGVGVTSSGMKTLLSDVASPRPTVGAVAMADTTVLRTRDTSYAAVGNRPGLYRIHVRRQPGTIATFQQRFEYVVQGTPVDMNAYVVTRQAAGDYLSYRIDTGGVAYAVFLCTAERTLGTGITALTFAQMRAGDLNGTLSTLWNRVDLGIY